MVIDWFFLSSGKIGTIKRCIPFGKHPMDGKILERMGVHMPLFANNMIRLSLQVLSILPMLFIKNSYGHASISIYNRYPILVIVLCAILLYGILSKAKFSLCCEILSYISLFSLLLFRVTIKMEGFVTLNSHLYGITEYVKFIVGVVLFLALLVYYSKRTYSFLISKKGVQLS